MWCAMSASKIIGPYFENRPGVAQTVNSDRYCAMLRTFLVPQLEEFDGFNQDTWFQQDGATAHTAWASMEVVRELFLEKVISRFGDLHWPARSPDLTPLDFFFVGISQKLSLC
uniref:Transposable element Tc3 transposase n=1 Tax=Anoplophora glabripennis TaxID=217634 RepID=V5I8Z8_ANOGL